VHDDIVERLFAGQHRRKHDAVVVDARLRPEHRHGVAIGRAGKQLVQHAAGRHSVADHDEFLFPRRCNLAHADS
jgi:hypothetical protein